MINKYRLITKLDTDLNVIPGAVPDTEGEFVFYEDHIAMLESIGAGGVSGQRLMKRTPISDEEIKRIALESGFTLKEGGDLRRYVYKFARNLLDASNGKSIGEHRAEFEDWYLEHIKPNLRPEKGVVFYTNNPSFVAWKAWKAAKGICE